MRRSWASITVGALVLIVGAISYKLVRSVDDRKTGGEGYVVYGIFHDASGLFEKSRVMTAGISVDTIEKSLCDLDGGNSPVPQLTSDLSRGEGSDQINPR